MRCKEIFELIDDLQEYYYDVWEDVLNLESPSNDKERVERVGDYIINFAEERGWTVERCKQDVSGDAICITMNPDSSLQPVSISGHIDTVHPVGIFGTPAARRDKDKIYGPGATDCKGGVVAGLLAMEALYKSGFTKRPIQLLLQTDEEVNSSQSNKKTIHYICEKAKDSIVFLNLESHARGYTTLVRKGIASYRFEVEGKESHSSRCVTEGANAIIDAAYKMIELDKLKDNEGITCNCGIVNGGSVVNTIPGKCVFAVNFRYATKEQYAWIENFVKELADTVHVRGCKCRVEQTEMRVAMELKERNLKILKKVNEIFEENGLPRLKHRTVRGGSDGADVSTYGIPCLDSLGTVGGGSHSINEYAELSSLAEAAKRIVAIAYYI